MSASNQTLSAYSPELEKYDAILKDWYSEDQVKMVVYKNNPFLAMLSKEENITGKRFILPVVFGDPQGVADTIAGAQSAASESEQIDFNLLRDRKYGIVNIDTETLEASKDMKGGFLDVGKLKTDGVLRQVTNDIATELFGDGTGELSIVAASPSPSTAGFSLANAADAAKFEVGMSLDIRDVIGTAQATKNGIIKSINRSTGAIVFASAATATSVSGDLIFRAGVVNKGIVGLSGWLPTTIASNDSFFGVNRFNDRVRLGGIYLDRSSDSTDDSIVNALETIITRVVMEGGTPDALFVHPIVYNTLKIYFQGKAQYHMTEVKIGDKAQIDFRGIVFDSSEGPVKLYSDRRCPYEYGFALQMDTWKLYSLGGVPHIQKPDGLMALRQASADGIEVRVASYAQLGCKAPGWNGKVKFRAASLSGFFS